VFFKVAIDFIFVFEGIFLIHLLAELLFVHFKDFYLRDFEGLIGCKLI